MLIGDYHTHTLKSHGKGTILDNAKIAYKKGLSFVGICDHGPALPFGLAVKREEIFLDSLREAKNIDFIQVLVGVEANILDLQGNLDVSNNVLSQLDFVAVGFHYPLNYRNINWELLKAIYTGKTEKLTDALILALEKHSRVHFVTHPMYRFPLEIERLAEICATMGVALELNAKHFHKGLFDPLKLDKRVQFVVNSDAHTPFDVGEISNLLPVLDKIPDNRLLNYRHS